MSFSGRSDSGLHIEADGGHSRRVPSVSTPKRVADPNLKRNPNPASPSDEFACFPHIRLRVVGTEVETSAGKS